MRFETRLLSFLVSSAILSILFFRSALFPERSSICSAMVSNFCLTSLISPSSLRNSKRSVKAWVRSALAFLICMSRRLRLGGEISWGSSGPQTSLAKVWCMSLTSWSDMSTRLISSSMCSRLFWPQTSTASCNSLMLCVKPSISCMARSKLRPSRVAVDFWSSTACSAFSILAMVLILYSRSFSSIAKLCSAKPSSRPWNETTTSLRSCKVPIAS
mmetsp:Transcript_81958/g.240602  ORF Transcript_81958/g.240602 Transcript_81958/m.240602 type:complete len:215 (-) Transcript_81958:381-1025(-)